MKKHIPNTLTCCNLLCGCFATGYAFLAASSYTLSALALSFTLIVCGAVFDFFDGFVARLLNVSSPIGKELDSLADVVTFGLAPSTIVFALFANILPHDYWWVGVVAFLMAAFSALRLAKFNLDSRQTMGFIGMPTPANALFWGAVALTILQHDEFVLSHVEAVCVLMGVGVLLCCWLLVCEVPMFALKFHDFSWAHNRLRYCFILASAAIIVMAGWGGLALVVVLYILLSVLQGKSNIGKA